MHLDRQTCTHIGQYATLEQRGVVYLQISRHSHVSVTTDPSYHVLKQSTSLTYVTKNTSFYVLRL